MYGFLHRNNQWILSSTSPILDYGRVLLRGKIHHKCLPELRTPPHGDVHYLGVHFGGDGAPGALCLYRVFNQTTSAERQDVSNSRTLASLPYKTSPVPAPIRRSFDTQLSNQDLAQVLAMMKDVWFGLMNDSSRGGLQLFSSINSGAAGSVSRWMTRLFKGGQIYTWSGQAESQTNTEYKKQ